MFNLVISPEVYRFIYPTSGPYDQEINRTLLLDHHWREEAQRHITTKGSPRNKYSVQLIVDVV